jgi:hypothetical protein
MHNARERRERDDADARGWRNFGEVRGRQPAGRKTAREEAIWQVAASVSVRMLVSAEALEGYLFLPATC